MLALVAGVSTLVFILASAFVGTRLLLLARRTRGLPEFAMGFGLAIIVGVGWATIWVFTWKVFRPESALCRWLVYAVLVGMALLMAAAMHYTLSLPDPRQLAYGDLRMLGNAFMAIASYLWAAVESLRYWGQMRKRAAIGLADPVLTNRFFLFAWVMIFSLTATGVPATASLSGIDTVSSPPIMLIASVSGLLCGLTLWFAFVPPEAYLRRLRTAA